MSHFDDPHVAIRNLESWLAGDEWGLDTFEVKHTRERLCRVGLLRRSDTRALAWHCWMARLAECFDWSDGRLLAEIAHIQQQRRVSDDLAALIAASRLREESIGA